MFLALGFGRLLRAGFDLYWRELVNVGGVSKFSEAEACALARWYGVVDVAIDPRSLSSFVGVFLSKLLLLIELFSLVEPLLGQLLFVQTSLSDPEPSLCDNLQVLDGFD